MTLLIAFATDDGDTLKGDEHFGMAKFFDVYEFYNNEERFIERRGNVKFKGDESIKHGDPEKAKATSSALDNVDIIVGGRFGPNITKLSKRYVCALVRTDTVKNAIKIVHSNISKLEEEKDKGEDRKHLVLTP
ncbi:MAG: hypothetical protein J7K94_03365 [Dehalococcoidia bacterium]|nr:hypothetical protein [Dehalococcoidia bacterium]